MLRDTRREQSLIYMGDCDVDNLYYSMRQCAHLLPPTEEKRVEVFTRIDGMNIPAGTVVRVVVELIHAPDPERTPILEMEAVPV